MAQTATRQRADAGVLRTNAGLCGFVCRACACRMRLSQEPLQRTVSEAFRAGMHSVSLTCPECRRKNVFARTDLKLFLGDAAPISLG